MITKLKLPRVGELVRHKPSGCPVRVERTVAPYIDIFTVLFADGMTEVVNWTELGFDLTESEKQRFSRDLPIVTGEALRGIMARRKR